MSDQSEIERLRTALDRITNGWAEYMAIPEDERAGDPSSDDILQYVQGIAQDALDWTNDQVG